MSPKIVEPLSNIVNDSDSWELIFFAVSQTSMSQQSSVLQSGNWYKIAVTEDGIYQITYDDFQNLGINISNLE